MVDNELHFAIPKYERSGIYAIINRTKGIAYVGESTNVKTRATQHKSQIKQGKHPIEELNRDKEDALCFVILHKFYDKTPTQEELNFYEKLYMYEFSDNGYKLYNQQSMSEWETTAHIACWIAGQICFDISALDNIKDAYFEKYQSNFKVDCNNARKKYK